MASSIYLVLWRRGVVVITTAQLYSSKPELKFCPVSNLACGVLEIHDGEDLWQWSRLEIRLNDFRQSVIPQKHSLPLPSSWSSSSSSSQWLIHKQLWQFIVFPSWQFSYVRKIFSILFIVWELNLQNNNRN